MIEQISVIFVILISLISTISFSQSSEVNDNINQYIFGLSTTQSVKPEKSSATFSIGAGYAGLTSNSSRPGGFDVQLDLIFPVTTYLAISGSFNYARFPGYQTTQFYGPQNGDYLIDNGAQTNVSLSPGVSFGNFKFKDKFNYFVTAGFVIGMGTTNGYTVTSIRNGEVLNHENGGLLEIMGILTSGRVSYKLSRIFQVYIEPSVYNLLGTDSAGSNYHINGGVSIAF